MSFLQQRCSQYTMQQMASTYGSSNMQITTELIQKYLDENKQLILAILDNQNLGKIHDCATYQAKLQQNLMYLAAIADAQQPQAGTTAAHNPPPQAAPAPPVHEQAAVQQYLQQQQLFMTQRNSIPQYLQQASQQQSFYTQQAMMQSGGGCNSGGLQMFSSERGIHGDCNGSSQLSAGFSDGGGSTRDGNQSCLGLRGDQIHHGGGRHGPDLGMVSDPQLAGHRDGGGSSGQQGGGGDDSETSYLKATSDASSL
ncbi:unnamed protein product [Sphagnum compactum]